MGNTFIWHNSTWLCMLSCCLLTDFHIYVLLEFFKLQAATPCLQRHCHLSTWLSPSLTPVHANPDICHQVYMHFPFTTSTHFRPCRGKLIMESYKARTKARSMKNKTLLCLFYLFLAFGDIYLKMPQSNIFCTDFGNAFTVGEISTILTGSRLEGFFMIMVYDQLQIFTGKVIAQHWHLQACLLAIKSKCYLFSHLSVYNLCPSGVTYNKDQFDEIWLYTVLSTVNLWQ